MKMITCAYSLDGKEIVHDYYTSGGIPYDMDGKRITRIWVYPVRQAIWGADYCTTLYFSTREKRDEYMAGHDYCDKLPRRKIPPID